MKSRHGWVWILGSLGVGALVGCHGCAQDVPSCDWTQWGHDSAHSGRACTAGQAPGRKLATFVFDPFVAQEQAESGGDLLAHYQTPLVVGDELYMLAKSGSYISCDPDGGQAPCGALAWNSQVWNEAHLQWKDGALVETWRFPSDWKPEPAVLVGGWEPVFQPAISGPYLYVPGFGGTVHKLDRVSGAEVAQLNPFGSQLDPNIYVAGGLSADTEGNVYYNALKLDPDQPFADAAGWLVKIAASGTVSTATYASLVPGAPLPTDSCEGTFPRSTPRPLPPPPDSSGNPVLPPRVPCLSQRPGINVAPAIGADGTVYTVSRAHGADHYAYVVAVHSDLTPKWAASLRDALNDGCGVLVPADATSDGGIRTHCRVGATLGVDPSTNQKPAGVATDLSSSSPVVLPDDSVLYGAFTGYNGSRGHLFRIGSDGHVLGTYDFGWDVTPAYYRHGSTFSIVTKDNHYAGELGPYLITQLDSNLTPEWSFKSTNTQSCVPDGGGLSCVDDHPNGFEWCVNAPAVDPTGVVYANSEDGNLYIIGPGGTERGRLFLNFAVGAAYTPVALDSHGRILALNGGVLTVVGQ